MDSPRDSDPNVVVDDERGRSTGERDRDLRDVLAHLVVAGDGRESVSLSEVAAAARGSDRLVPELLAALEDDATAVRIGAAWTLCALADERPAAVEYLTQRVAERMADGDEPFEVSQVLSYLRGRYPGRVADAIDATAGDSLAPPGADRRTDPVDGSGPGAGRASDAGPDAGDATASGPEGKRIETDGGVPAGTVADLGDNRQVVRPDGGPTGVHQRADGTRHPGDAPTGPGRGPADAATPESHPTHPDFESSDDGEDAADPTAGAGTNADPTAVEPASDSPPVTEDDHRPETPETFASIAALSSFDQLSAVDEGVEERYAASYRCRAVDDGSERGVAVRLFDRPDESDRLEFCADLEDRLARWQALGAEEHVVGVAEWGERPRPWVATDPVDRRLIDRNRPSVEEALHEAIALAEAVGSLHAHGAVHAGIDPRNVVYADDTFSEVARPMLDNVGLMGPYRTHFDPANYLDPRFAAPEYFDDDVGAVDAATDIYGLGAVTYLLLTGRPPYTGSLAEVREGILAGSPPAPSRVNDALPPSVDDALSRALAREKLNRYETAGAFSRALRRVRERA